MFNFPNSYKSNHNPNKNKASKNPKTIPTGTRIVTLIEIIPIAARVIQPMIIKATIPTVSAMPADDVTFNTIGFTGTMTANSTFTLYRDSEGTGAKSYNVYCKNLSGNYTLTLTTGVSGASNFTIKGGRNIVARILVDENGNIVSQSMTATDLIESENNQPATSGAVYESLLSVEEVTITTVNASCSWYVCKCFKIGKFVQIFGIAELTAKSENRIIATGFPIPLELDSTAHVCFIFITGSMGNIVGNVKVDKNGNLHLLNATFSGENFYFGGSYICE